MSILPLSWQTLRVEPHFSLNQLKKSKVTLLDLQPKVKQEFEYFLKAPTGTLLIIASETLPEYLSEIEDYFGKDNIIIQSEFNQKTLFGYTKYVDKKDEIIKINGAIEKANNKILLLNINSLLSDIKQWDKLKYALLLGYYSPIILNDPPIDVVNNDSQFKLMLIGDKSQIALLEEYDVSLYQYATYTEISSYLNLTDHAFIDWANYIQSLAQKWIKRTLGIKALVQYFQYAIKQSESQYFVSICPTLAKKDILAINSFYQNGNEIIDELSGYFEHYYEKISQFYRYSLMDILNSQTYIETEGEVIGQINGLSIVEFSGLPFSFGEPIRITCNIQHGEGEITDIESKVELGGNIHSKGVLIAQSCVAKLLELPSQFPFSAHIAFEQSYQEVDGDSSSLAIFCLLIGTLSKLPIPQSIAITGAIDQLGNVLSVGGVNQKVESFFNLCRVRGLNKQQGVIIPASCLSHLSLSDDLIEAVQREEFNIWAVSDVFQTLSLLFKKTFYEERESQSEEVSLFSMIHSELAQHMPPRPLKEMILNWRKWCFFNN